MSGCSSLASNNNLFAHFSVFSVHLFSTVSLTTGLDLLGYSSYYSPSSVLSTPATVDSATLHSCPPCRRWMSSLTYTHIQLFALCERLFTVLFIAIASIYHRLLPLGVTVFFSIVLYFIVYEAGGHCCFSYLASCCIQLYCLRSLQFHIQLAIFHGLVAVLAGCSHCLVV